MRALATLLLGQMLPVFFFFLRLAARTSTVLLSPPPLLLGQMLPVFYTVGVLGDPSLCYPLHYTWVKCCLVWCDECWRVGRPFTVLPPYTTPRLNAACFGAISVGVLGDSSLCYLPTLHLGQMLPVSVRRVPACWANVYCATPLHCT